MSNYGLLVNAGISFLIALSGGAMALIVFIRKRESKIRPLSFSFAAFWGAITMVYLFAALRMVAAFYGNQALDALFYQIDNAFGGLMLLPSVFLALFLITSNRLLGAVGAIVAGIIWAIWLVVMYTNGLDFATHTLGYWHSDWDQVSKAAKQIAIFGLYLPGAFSIIAMFFGLFRVNSAFARYRLIMTVISMLLTMTLIIVEFMTTDPVAGIWIRSGLLAAVLIGIFAYFPPRGIKARLENVS